MPQPCSKIGFLDCITESIRGALFLITEPLVSPARKPARPSATQMLTPNPEDEIKDMCVLDRSLSRASTSAGSDITIVDDSLLNISGDMLRAVEAACACTMQECCRSESPFR
jgi:hypothetical protein